MKKVFFLFPIHIESFGIESLPDDEFVSSLLIIAIKDYRENFNRGDDFIIDSMVVSICTNPYKINHKNKFYKSLYDDLMKVAWHPSRYLDWCIDVEELKFLEELWGDED